MGFLSEEDHEAVRTHLRKRYIFDEDIISMTSETWSKFNGFRRNGDFCDVEIDCRDGTLLAHKCILAAASPYFLTLFTSPLTSPTGRQKINFKNYSVKTVDSVLQYIYDYPCYEIADSTNVEELLELAEYIHLDLLVKELVESIRSTLEVNNCFGWCAVTKSCGVRKGFVIARSFILLNLEYLTEEHQALSADIQEILAVNDPVFLKETVMGICRERQRSKATTTVHDVDICVIDPMENILEEFQDTCRKYFDIDCHQFFVFDLNLFAVVLSGLIDIIDRYEEGYIGHQWVCLEEDASISLGKYNQISCNFDDEDMVEIELAALWSKGLNPCYWPRRYLLNLFYDNDKYLYIITCEWTNENLICTHKIFKMDLKTMAIFENWITIDPRSKSVLLVQSQTYGTILVDALNEVFLVEKFDFQSMTNKSNHSPLPLSISLEGSRRSKRRKVLPAAECKKSWCVLNYQGTVYWFGILDDYPNLHVYYLDEKENCWMKFCIGLYGLQEIDHAFQYQQKVFLKVIVEQKIEFHHFDIEKKMISKAMDLPHSHTISVVPEHFFY